MDNELQNFLDGLKESVQRYLYIYTNERDRQTARICLDLMLEVQKDFPELTEIAFDLLEKQKQKIAARFSY